MFAFLLLATIITFVHCNFSVLLGFFPLTLKLFSLEQYKMSVKQKLCILENKMALMYLKKFRALCISIQKVKERASDFLIKLTVSEASIKIKYSYLTLQHYYFFLQIYDKESQLWKFLFELSVKTHTIVHPYLVLQPTYVSEKLAVKWKSI